MFNRSAFKVSGWKWRLADPLVPMWLTTVLLAVIVALTATGCSFGYPHACDGHGGTRGLIKGIYYCHDGSTIGSGWLWLHPHDPRSRP
jgi:hypothetical protein